MGGMEFYRLITLSDRSYPAPDNLASLHTALACPTYNTKASWQTVLWAHLIPVLKVGFFLGWDVFFWYLILCFRRIQNILQGHSCHCHSREYCGTNLVESFQNMLYCMQALGPWRWNCTAQLLISLEGHNPILVQLQVGLTVGKPWITHLVTKHTCPHKNRMFPTEFKTFWGIQIPSLSSSKKCKKNHPAKRYSETRMIGCTKS